MRKLWDRDISYRLLRTISHGDVNEDGEVWGELVALNSDHSPLATELSSIGSETAWSLRCVYTSL